MTFDNQVAGNGKAGRSRTNYCNLLASSPLFGGELSCAIFTFVVGTIALEITDGDRITFSGQDTFAFGAKDTEPRWSIIRDVLHWVE